MLVVADGIFEVIKVNKYKPSEYVYFLGNLHIVSCEGEDKKSMKCVNSLILTSAFQTAGWLP